MLAVFGIDNAGLSLVVNLLILFMVVVWLALVYWTYADARRRISEAQKARWARQRAGGGQKKRS